MSRITMSSDGNGSSPLFNEVGKLTTVSINSTSTLWREARDLVLKEGLELEKALCPVTINVAKALKLLKKGEIKEGMDADIVLLTPSLEVHTVICLGKIMVENKVPKVLGTFETKRNKSFKIYHHP